MKNKNLFKPLFISICLVLLVISFINTQVFSRGKITVVVYNQTSSEQTIWLSPKEEYTYVIPSGEKRKVKYSTEDFIVSLILHYYDIGDIPKKIMLSEYVEDHERGTVEVKINQKKLGEKLEFEILDKIN